MNIPFEIDESHKLLVIPFINWCNNNSISVEHEDDCKPYWDCFLAGATCMYLMIKSKN